MNIKMNCEFKFVNEICVRVTNTNDSEFFHTSIIQKNGKSKNYIQSIGVPKKYIETVNELIDIIKSNRW